jgi:hypothetical protein
MRQNNITFLWHVAPCSLVDWHKYFKGTCCLHLQGRRCKLSRTEIYVIQGRESNLSSTMAACSMYPNGRGSGFLQTLAQIYHTIQRHIPDEAAGSPRHWHKSTTLYSATFQMRQQVPPDTGTHLPHYTVTHSSRP